MSEPTIRGVHLFCDSILIAHFSTTDAAPETSYNVEGVTYDVTSFAGPFLQSDGAEGWDVQVVRREESI